MKILENSEAVNFLGQWEPPQRSGIANLFYRAVREGASTRDSVIKGVREAIRRREAKDAARRGFVRLASLLDTNEGQAFAQYVIDRENLPPEQKAKVKAETRHHYQKEYLRAQKPTLKQLNYLRNLGCLVVPQNRLEASELIDSFRTRGFAIAASPHPLR